MPKQTLSGDAARAALLAGVDAVCDPVKITLGPRGRNVLIDRPGQPIATRDGVTVAKECSNLPDRFQNMGAAYAREVADAAVVEAGDGTTTASVILQSIVREGLKLVDAGAEPLLLADGINAAAASCADFIKAMAIPATPELVRQAAIISTHGDVDLGTMIAAATCKVGATGVLELQESRDENTTIEHLEGFYFERGWRGANGANQVFVNDPTGQKSVLDKPLILISDRVIAGGTQGLAGDHVFNVMQMCVTARRPLIIIADDLVGDAYTLFAANVHAKTLPGGCFVKLPGFAEHRAAAIEDLRIAVGAKTLHTATGKQLSSFTLDDLGTCSRSVISPVRTVLIEGNANTELLPKRIRQLMQQSRDTDNPFEKEQLDHRIARLTGGVAVLRVGAHSEPAMIEKKARAEDAIHACRGALQAGVLPGGGVALLRAAMSYKGIDEYDQTGGALVLLNAIVEPAKQIVRNAGEDADTIIASVIKSTSPSMGFDSANRCYGDMYIRGIVDPAKVVLTALQKAASVGALLLTTEVLVTDLPEQSLAIPGPQPQYRY